MAESQQPSLNPHDLSADRRSASSYGRGGAGNINIKRNSNTNTSNTDTSNDNKKTNSTGGEASDLTTPTIKSANYTTGRGGTGNMAVNDPSQPGLARTAQDVEAPPSMTARDRDGLPSGTYHWGRGGEGNMVTVGGQRAKAGDEAAVEAARNASKERKKVGGGAGGGEGADGGERRGSFRETVVQRGREMLGFGKGKAGESGSRRSEAGREESAIDDA